MIIVPTCLGPTELKWAKNTFLEILFNRYHYFHNRPLPGPRFLMECIPEPNNPVDQWACKVIAPTADTIEPALLNLPTRLGPQHQLVRDICRLTIGRIPSGVCNIVSIGRMQNWMERAVCMYTGRLIHDGPVHGGSPKLECLYLFEFTQDAPFEMITFLRPHLLDEDSFYF